MQNYIFNNFDVITAPLFDYIVVMTFVDDFSISYVNLFDEFLELIDQNG